MAIGLNHETEIARPGMDSIMEVGSIYGTARSNVPSGYLLCDGSVISRTTYSRLFSAIGATYGSGDGSTTFTIPDLRGVVPRGAGTSVGYTQNITVTLGTKNNDAIQGHRHPGVNGSFVESGIGGNIYRLTATNATPQYGTIVLDPSTDTINGIPRTANETRVKNLGVNFFIKF